MQVLIPRQVVAYKLGGGVSSVNRGGYTLPCWAVVQCDEVSEKLSYFKDTDGLQFNTVCHSKPISETGDVLTIVPTVRGSTKYLPYVTLTGNISGAASGRYREWWIVTPSHTLVLTISPAFRKVGPMMYRLDRLSLYMGAYRIQKVGSSYYRGFAHNKVEVAYDRGESDWRHVQLSPSSLPRYPFPPPEQKVVFAKDQYLASDQVIEELFRDVDSWSSVVGAMVDSMTITSRDYRVYPVSGMSQIPPPDGRAGFHFNEPSYLLEGYPELLVTKNSYWRNWLIQHAYVDCLQSAPRLNDNSISNALEIFSFMKTLVVDHRIEIPKSLGSAWLSYRYAFSTSKLDAEEAIQFVRRNMSISMDRGIKCFGRSSWAFEDGTEVTCRCGLTLVNNELDIIERAWRALYTYGLQPNFYVIWDMIPYSFIVDWFVPIGDIASVLDTEANMLRGQYSINDVNFSFSYDKPQGDYLYHYYSRWHSAPLTSLNEFYWFDKPKASDKVKSYRILDAISLSIGK